MITTAPRKEFTLDYSISKVVTTVNSTLRLAGHRLLDSNNVLKTYRIALVYGLNTAILTIQLTQNEEIKTKCFFEIFNTVGSQIQPATLTGMLDKFLLSFTDLLTGKTKIIEKTQTQIAAEKKKQSTNLILTIVIGVIFLIVFYYYIKGR